MDNGPQPRVGRGRPALYGIIWGAGLGVSITYYLLLESRSAYSSLALWFFIGPVVCLLCTTITAVIYVRFARTSTNSGSLKYLGIAVAGALALAAAPYVVESGRLYVVAYRDIPFYPGSQRLETTVHPGGSAKVTVRLHTSSHKEDVMRYYNEELKRRHWATYVDSPVFYVSAVNGQRTMSVFFDEKNGEIRAESWRYFASH